MPLRALTVLVISLAVAGCGGAGERPAAAPGPREIPEPAPAAEREAAAEPAAGEAPEAPAASSRASVDMKGYEFRPSRVEVEQGSSVTWRDRDHANHTVTFAEGGPRGIRNLRPGRSRSVDFAKAGTYEYRCEFHPTMTGVVVVR